jgi:hypothetical protein
MKLSITESGVVFGEFEEDDVFGIEKALIKHRFDQKGVKSVEFIVRQQHLNKPLVSLVEARSSVPRQPDAFFEEIRLKLQHTLIIWFCAVSGRHSALTGKLPENFSLAETLKLPLRLILVVPALPDAHIVPMTDAFRVALRLDCRLWGIDQSAVFVLNKSRAARLGLVEALVAPTSH